MNYLNKCMFILLDVLSCFNVNYIRDIIDESNPIFINTYT